MSKDLNEETAMGILYSYGRIDPAIYCEGRFIAYKTGDVEKALDMGIKAIGFKKELKEKLSKEIIDAQIAEAEFNASSSDERIKDALNIMNFLGLSYQVVKPFGVVIDGEEFRGWITDHENHRYEIIDGQEFRKRMEVSA